MPNLVVQTVDLIIQLGSALLLGFLAFRLGWVTEKQGLAFLTGRIGLPLLAFKAVATSDLDDMEPGVIVSCAIGKLFVYVLACGASWIGCRKESRDKALISAAIFSFHVTAANDFVFGFPIIQAFYPDKGSQIWLRTSLSKMCFSKSAACQCLALAPLSSGKAKPRSPLALRILHTPIGGSVVEY